MSATRKTWKTPELTVLVRSRTEEAVLAACKGTGMAGPGRPSIHECNKKSSPCSVIGAS
jgi:hypothetical protein